MVPTHGAWPVGEDGRQVITVVNVSSQTEPRALKLGDADPEEHGMKSLVQVAGEGFRVQKCSSRDLKYKRGFPGWRWGRNVLAEGTACAGIPWQEGALQELRDGQGGWSPQTEGGGVRGTW